MLDFYSFIPVQLLNFFHNFFKIKHIPNSYRIMFCNFFFNLCLDIFL